MTIRLGFLASYNGSSARAITEAAASGRLDARPVVLIHNNADAPAQIWAREAGLRVERLSSVTHADPDELDRAVRDVLVEEAVDLVVLSGYMKRLGPRTIDAFRGRVLNVHPAPLPRFGGEGMWGLHVHQAVLDAGVEESAVTIHEVDEEYDHGPVLHTQAVDIRGATSAEEIQRRVAEHEPETYIGAVRAYIQRHQQSATTSK